MFFKVEVTCPDGTVNNTAGSLPEIFFSSGDEFMESMLHAMGFELHKAAAEEHRVTVIGQLKSALSN